MNTHNTNMKMGSTTYSLGKKESDGEATTAKSKSSQSGEGSAKISKYLWVELSAHLRNNPTLRKELRHSFDAINVSKDTMVRFKQLSPALRQCVEEFGNQNCLRAISVLENLTEVKKNQYKFLYEGLTLAAAVEIVCKESTFLFRSLNKHETGRRHFLRLVESWIDYVFIVHAVAEDARRELARQIVIQIGILNNVTLHNNL